MVARLIGGPADGQQVTAFVSDRYPRTITVPIRRPVSAKDFKPFAPPIPWTAHRYNCGYIENGIAYYIHESLKVKTA
jgi:hypothetical protein